MQVILLKQLPVTGKFRLSENFPLGFARVGFIRDDYCYLV